VPTQQVFFNRHIWRCPFWNIFILYYLF
jgi:hypothetical protein